MSDENESSVVVENTEENLISATEARLNEVFEGQESTPVSAVESTESAESVISTPTSAVESAESAESTSVSAVESTESAESVISTPTSAVESVALEGLSDGYYRAAVHQGWKPEEINDFFKKDPELAKRTFARLYDSTNALSQEFAAIGRAKQETTKSESDDVVVKKSDEFKAVDIEKLRRDYDNDPVVELVAQMQDQNKALFDKIAGSEKEVNTEVVDEQQLRAKIQEEALIEQQITQFFNDSNLKQYKDFYGELSKESKNWDVLSVEQKTKRWNVLEMADQILLGAESQGRKMNVNEALTLAHLNVSEPMRTQVIRNEIKAKVKKRSAGLTLRPAGAKTMKSTGKRTGAELETKVAGRLAKVFG